MSISSPQRPASRGTDHADRPPDEPAQRRSFPGWQWLAVCLAFPVSVFGAGGALLFMLLSGLLLARSGSSSTRAPAEELTSS